VHEFIIYINTTGAGQPKMCTVLKKNIRIQDNLNRQTIIGPPPEERRDTTRLSRWKQLLYYKLQQIATNVSSSGIYFYI